MKKVKGAKRENIDKYIERLKKERVMYLGDKEKPFRFFHELLDCPHDEIPRFLVARYICKELNSIYATDKALWQVASYEKNIVLAFGRNGYIPPMYFDSEGKYVEYKHLQGYDCLSLNIEYNTFYEAEYAKTKIFSDLRSAGF